MENIQLVAEEEVSLNSMAQDSIVVATSQFKRMVPSPVGPSSKSSSSNGGSSQPPPTLGVKFISAGLSACIADLVTFPLDTAKVRLQIQGEGSVAQRTASNVATSTFRSGSTLSCARAFTSAAATAVAAPKYSGLVGCVCAIQKTEGVKGLYNGLVPGLQRQMCFASIRIGTYDSVKQMYINLFNADVSKNNIGLRMLAGITTGAGAVICAQPTDVVKVRMQAQSKGNIRYSSALNAYRTIALKEGIRGLWRGTGPNVTRNSVVNCTELVSYDLIKEFFLHRRLLDDSTPCHFISAIGAGFCTTVLASPVDVVKTRLMNSAPGVYSGALNCALVMFKTEGVRAFYKGFTPSFLRFGSWNIVMFVTYEQMKKLVSSVTSNRSEYQASALLLKKDVSSLVKSDSSRYM